MLYPLGNSHFPGFPQQIFRETFDDTEALLFPIAEATVTNHWTQLHDRQTWYTTDV